MVYEDTRIRHTYKQMNTDNSEKEVRERKECLQLVPQTRRDRVKIAVTYSAQQIQLLSTVNS